MSEIREVSIEYGRTVNLGNYESERLHVGLRATVGRDDDDQVVTYELVEAARQSVASHLERLERKRREAVARTIRRSNVLPGEDDPTEGTE